MKVWTNITGTTASDFTIGKEGVTIYHGETVPDSGLGQDGDVYIRQGDSAAIYQKDSGSWRALIDIFERQDVSQGASAVVIGDAATYVGIIAGASSATSLVLPTGTSGKVITVKDETGSAGIHNISISGATIDGGSSYTIATNYGSVTLTYVGDAWSVVRTA